MKRVLIFSTNYFPYVGGAEIAVKKITDRYPQTNGEGVIFDMLVPRLSFKDAPVEKVGEVTVYRVGFPSMLNKFAFPIFGTLKAMILNRKANYQVLWSIMASHASVGAAFFKYLYPDKKLLLTLQEGDEEDHLKRYTLGNAFLYSFFIQPWHLLVFKLADRVTVISEYLKNRALENGVRCPIDIVSNGVDVAHFTKKPEVSEIEALRQKLGKKQGDIFLITTSRLVKKNAVEDCIAALSLLPENISFVIVGEGPLEMKLKEQAKKSGLEPRVKFIGKIPYAVVPLYLSVSDIFIRPSLSEGFGNSFIEAMAAGVPVIATPVGGIVDFLIDPNNATRQPTGLFCGVKNPQSIAEKVTQLLSDDMLRSAIVVNAREMVVKNYDWQAIAVQTKSVIDQLIA